jgi:hypothetical protein
MRNLANVAIEEQSRNPVDPQRPVVPSEYTEALDSVSAVLL